MAGSLQVISSTAAGDITDRVVHERTGLLFPPGDTGALLSCMRALVSDRERRRTWGRAGYEIIRDRTVDRWAERFEEFAHSVVEDRPSAQPFAGQSAEAASAR
jgi:glycosyltransferase involved in cell wall biosynthesis